MQHSGIQTNHTNNRKKLIEQNKKLNNEIRMLEKKMSKVITTDIIKTMEEQKKRNEGEEKMHELVVQETYMKKLKEKLKQLRSLNIGKQTEGIKREEDQLKILKKKHEEMLVQKQTALKMYQHKETHLQYNQPLQNFKGQTTDQLAKVRKKNAEMQSKLIEIEREIRKYHKYQQMNNSFKNQPVVVNNPQYQIKKIEHEKVNWEKKSKLVEHKWKPQIEALDNQYFAEREVFDMKNGKIKQLEKELKNWQNRSSASRSEADVILDRERISKVITASPPKKRSPEIPKQNINKKPKPFPKNGKKNQTSTFSELIKQFKETQKSNKLNNTSKQLQAIDEIPDMRKWTNKMNESKYATQSQKIELSNTQAKYNATRLSQKNNEFILSKNAKSEERSPPKKIDSPNKMKNAVMNSVGVGTSFYYNDDE